MKEKRSLREVFVRSGIWGCLAVGKGTLEKRDQHSKGGRGQTAWVGGLEWGPGSSSHKLWG